MPPSFTASGGSSTKRVRQFVRQRRHFVNFDSASCTGRCVRRHAPASPIFGDARRSRPAEFDPLDQLASSAFSFGICCKRSLQRDEVARVSGSLAQPSDSALDVANRFQFRTNRPSKSGSCNKSAIICWRACSSVRSRNGCKIQARNLRAPMGVTVRSSTRSRLVSRAPRDSTSSRLACVAASSRT